MRLVAAFVTLALTLGSGAIMAQDAREWLNRGVTAFKNAQYQDAVSDFQKAVDLAPDNATARLYLATTYMQQYIPGSESRENLDMAQRAEEEFRKVFAVDARNKVALASLASLSLNQKKWDNARDWYHQLLNVDPNNADAYYSLGFITWSQWYPAYSVARKQLGMNQEQPGPIPNVSVRNDLRAQYWGMLDDGLWNLHKALEINPQYDDAMAYINLLVRERADLRDTKEEYTRDIAEADQWVQKVLDTKKAKAQGGGLGMAVPPPPPPPPPPPSSGQTPSRIRIGSNVQANNLISKVDPVYPALAQQARIQGTVQLSVTISREGAVQNIQVLSGHPLLVPAALEAVKQWVYKPTLLNSNPVEVITIIEVPFTL
jgi:TonB family protein